MSVDRDVNVDAQFQATNGIRGGCNGEPRAVFDQAALLLDSSTSRTLATGLSMIKIIPQLQAILGSGGLLTAEEAAERAAGVWRSDTITAACIVRPRTTEQVSQVLKLCHDHNVSVVTHGGLTGLVHAADAKPCDVILSLELMRSIERVDPIQRTAVAEAGVTLQSLQEAAEAEGLSFPLDLGGRGTATIGGNAATNAGGNRVIRYGMMRDMVLGLEAVLADGTVVSSMNNLIKNNTGYDLKQLFIGSEGTLGVITRLVLRLREKSLTRNMAFVAAETFNDVAQLLKHMDGGLGGSLSAFEVMWHDFYRLVTREPAQGRPPVNPNHNFYVLIESQGASPEQDALGFQAVLESALSQGLIVDAAIAQSEQDCLDFWRLRDDVEQTFRWGEPIIFDVSLPTSAMEAYTQGVRDDIEARLPGARVWIFGHLGDGNLHLAVQTEAGDATKHRETIEHCVYQPLQAVCGSISAEHGVGLEKKPYLHLCRSEIEIGLMRAIKATLDPKGLLNPGKIF